jgi:hypothetical protein
VDIKNSVSLAFDQVKTKQQYGEWVAGYLSYRNPTLSNDANETAAKFLYSSYHQVPGLSIDKDEEIPVVQNVEDGEQIEQPLANADKIGEAHVKKLYRIINHELLPAFIARLIKTYTAPGDVVFDPFMGAGSTAEQCIKNDRKFIGCEINPHAYKIANAWLNHEFDVVHRVLIEEDLDKELLSDAYLFYGSDTDLEKLTTDIR